jgi:xanthine dehydrogenase YagR molybdenum-binding subunit
MNEYLSELLFADPDDRVDGKAKVTGNAKFAAEYDIPGLLYGVFVNSTIAKGTIKAIDTRNALWAPGVKDVITYLNRPKVPGWDDAEKSTDPKVPGKEFYPFFDNKVYFNGQPVALVVANTFERAQYAATLVKLQYNKELQQTNMQQLMDKAVDPPKKEQAKYERGNQDAYNSAIVKIDATYLLHPHIHNQMEPHAAIGVWDGPDKVTLYNKAQFVQGTQESIVKSFKLKKEDVRVISKYTGGAFGGASRFWPHEPAAVLAAKKLNQPVKVVIGRDDQFTMVGHRPEAVQQIKIGAAADGTILSLAHHAYGHTSTYEQFAERITDSSKFLYNCDNVLTTYKLVPVNVGTPTYTRGPGETSGVFALETAMDEAAIALNMDPIDFRMKNYALLDPEKNLPFSAKYLDECYKKGAESIGWQNRNATPGAVRKEDWLIGMGMSSAVYGARRSAATVKAVLKTDGSMLLQTAVADSGPGASTVMVNVAAETAGIPADKIYYEIGDSTYPPAPGQFGSTMTASIGSAVHDVCVALKQRLAELAVAKAGGSFANVKPEDIIVKDGWLWAANNGAEKISYIEVLQKNGLAQLEITKESKAGPEQTKYSVQCFGASFVEVMVHRLTGVVKVTRVTSVIDNGKVINKKTARNQVLGCIAWGIGMALMEEGVMDHRYGRYVNANLADYHVAVNADVPETNVIFIDKPDYILDPMGAKGLGEIPLVGFAAAVGNAVYNATGKRIRELPITPDKLV